MWGRKQLESANNAWYTNTKKKDLREKWSQWSQRDKRKVEKDIIYVHIIYREREKERERKSCNVKKRKRSGERNDKFDEIKRIKAMSMLTVCWYLCSAQ